MIKEKDIRHKILSNIDTIQLAQSKVIFDQLVKLFTEKYSNQKDFIEFFKQQHVQKNYNWFEGASIKSPSTNNALEGTNAIIKSNYTHRDRLPLGRFFSMVIEMVSDWSSQRSPGQNKKIFRTTVVPTLKEWTDAYHFSKYGPNISEAVIFCFHFIIVYSKQK